MSIVDLAKRIIDSFNHDGETKTIPELAALLDTSEGEINQAIDWLVDEGFGDSWIAEPEPEPDEESETEFDREYLEGCLDSQGEVIEVTEEWRGGQS